MSLIRYAASERDVLKRLVSTIDQDPIRSDLTQEWNTHRLLSDAGILDECLRRAERIMLERRLAAAREVVADLERQLVG